LRRRLVHQQTTNGKNDRREAEKEESTKWRREGCAPAVHTKKENGATPNAEMAAAKKDLQDKTGKNETDAVEETSRPCILRCFWLEKRVVKEGNI